MVGMGYAGGGVGKGVRTLESTLVICWNNVLEFNENPQDMNGDFIFVSQ